VVVGAVVVEPVVETGVTVVELTGAVGVAETVVEPVFVDGPG
jgi:hypothetical protein